MEQVESEKWTITVRDTDNEHMLHNAHVNSNDYHWDEWDDPYELRNYVAQVCKTHPSRVTVERN